MIDLLDHALVRRAVAPFSIVKERPMPHLTPRDRFIADCLLIAAAHIPDASRHIRLGERFDYAYALGRKDALEEVVESQKAIRLAPEKAP